VFPPVAHLWGEPTLLEPADHGWLGGGIRVGPKWFMVSRRLQVGALFHELTHKIGGTSDWAYINLRKLYETGEIEYVRGDPKKPTVVKLSEPFRVRNADSYHALLRQYYLDPYLKSTPAGKLQPEEVTITFHE
jgi:hypothetical protein